MAKEVRFNDLEEIKLIEALPKNGEIFFKNEKYVECFRDDLPYKEDNEQVFCVIYESIRKNGAVIKVEFLMKQPKPGVYKGFKRVIKATKPKY